MGPRLEIPLRKIAALAIQREPSARHAADPDLQLFPMRRFIGSHSAEAIAATLRQLVEVATSRTLTIRWAGTALVPRRFMTPDGFVTCVLCPFGTPEGRLEQPVSGMFVFYIVGGNPGYLT